MNEINKAKHSAEKGADLAGDILDGVKDRFTGLVDDAKDTGEELLEEATAKGQRLWDKAQDNGEDAWKNGKTWIVNHPGAAIGYSFVAGAFAYAYLTRRKEV
jgi:hypothetical protein